MGMLDMSPKMKAKLLEQIDDDLMAIVNEAKPENREDELGNALTVQFIRSLRFINSNLMDVEQAVRNN